MAYRDRGFPTFGGFQMTPWVKRLLIANVVVYFLTLVAPGFFLEWFSFQPAEILWQPWGIATYMFLHGDFWHLFFNMLVLFFFGPPLEGRWGSKEFLKYYAICGLGGAALGFVFAPTSMVIGASAAVYGIMLAFAMNWPDAPIYIYGIFPVKAKWLMAFLFGLTLWGMFSGPGSSVAHFAHLGGILTGFIYLKQDWRGAEKLGKLKKKATRRRRLAIVPRDDGEEEEEEAAGSHARGRSAEEEALLDAVDQVLDKISAQGMASLTAEERRLLDEVSRRRRTN